MAVAAAVGGVGMWATGLLQLSTSPHPRPSRVRPEWTSRRLVLPLPEAIGLADEFEQMGVMGEPIE